MTRVAGVIDLIGYLLSGHFLVAPSDLTSPSLYCLWALACTCQVCIKCEFSGGGGAAWHSQACFCLVPVPSGGAEGEQAERVTQYCVLPGGSRCRPFTLRVSLVSHLGSLGTLVIFGDRLAHSLEQQLRDTPYTRAPQTGMILVGLL